ncbi:TauD/TfdA family dioxygenase [Kitasatospora terrestris]|uniref:Clavaminate synthase family protein n=1 Tax=Kitasatospora terrestris TaxID=258051 RepID=A0ABP9DED3_9ACTN
MSVLAAPDAAPDAVPARTLRLELTGPERAAIRQLAGELAGTAPALLDDHDWLAEARRLSCRLPLRLLEGLRELRQDSGRGLFVLAGLPIDVGTLPNTPTVAGSVERLPRLPAAVAMLLGQQLGEVVAYRDEKQGALVQNVVPVSSLAHTQSNAGSVQLELHNENAFHPHRPDLIGLLCLRTDHEGRAGTLVASIRDALALLTEDELALLRAPRFVTEAPPSFGAGGATEPHPLLGGSPTDPDIRVDFNATAGLDDEAGGAMAGLGAALLASASSLVLRPGEMVFIDNRLVVHGRTDFTPRYDGRDRWLHRIYVHLDSRRSAGSRTGRGPVLI